MKNDSEFGGSRACGRRPRCFVGLKLAGGVCNGRERRAKKIFKGEDGLSVRACAGGIVNEEIIKA